MYVCHIYVTQYLHGISRYFKEYHSNTMAQVKEVWALPENYLLRKSVVKSITIMNDSLTEWF